MKRADAAQVASRTANEEPAREKNSQIDGLRRVRGVDQDDARHVAATPLLGRGLPTCPWAPRRAPRKHSDPLKILARIDCDRVPDRSDGTRPQHK